MDEKLTDILGHRTASLDCKEYYLELQSSCNQVVKETFCSDVNNRIGKSHSFIHDLYAWNSIISRRPEGVVFFNAITEYQLALLSLIQGSYRHSFMALRLFMEMSLATLQFSAHEIDLRMWMNAEKDIKWSTLIDRECGVLSKVFARSFCDTLVEHVDEYSAIALKVYRECSGFVHGNAYTHDAIPKRLQYHSDIVTEWHKKADSIRLVVSFALCIRYINYLSDVDQHLIEPIINDHLGHISSLRQLLGGATEAQ